MSFDEEQRSTCPDCRQEIDEDTCWCGDSYESHKGVSHNHGFVPMGCTCGFVKSSPQKGTT